MARLRRAQACHRRSVISSRSVVVCLMTSLIYDVMTALASDVLSTPTDSVTSSTSLYTKSLSVEEDFDNDDYEWPGFDYHDIEYDYADYVGDDGGPWTAEQSRIVEAGRQSDKGDVQSTVPLGAASLTFVFDVTGSMHDDLVQVIEGAARILATTLAMRDKPLYNYVLVPFHDPG